MKINNISSIKCVKIMVADTTDYVGPVIYNRGGATTVRYEGGFATLDPSTAAPDFYHYVTDYQGNNRGVIHAASGQLVQVTHYYPFGAVYADMGTGADLQPFKHGDKELDMMHGLCHYDYLARPYDPILCTFTRPDSRATSYPHISPRAFCANNPVNYVDPDGNATWKIHLSGQYYEEIDDESDEYTIVFYKDGVESEPVTLSSKSSFGISQYDGDNGYKYLIISVRGDENGKAVFESAANINLPKNDKNEFTLWQVGEEGEKGLNLISTSGFNEKDTSGSFLFTNQLRYGYTLRNEYHNHPYNSKPSGFEPGDHRGDKFHADYVISTALGTTPKFAVYRYGSYHFYNNKKY